MQLDTKRRHLWFLFWYGWCAQVGNERYHPIKTAKLPSIQPSFSNFVVHIGKRALRGRSGAHIAKVPHGNIRKITTYLVA